MRERSIKRQECVNKVCAILRRRRFISHQEIQNIKLSYDVNWTTSNLTTTVKNTMWPIKVDSIYKKGYVIHTR